MDDIKLNLVGELGWLAAEFLKVWPFCSSIVPPSLQTATDYGSYLANEPSPLLTTTIVEKCTQKLVDDWNKMRCQVHIGDAATHSY
jgi:hypothetical protein